MGREGKFGYFLHGARYAYEGYLFIIPFVYGYDVKEAFKMRLGKLEITAIKLRFVTEELYNQLSLDAFTIINLALLATKLT